MYIELIKNLKMEDMMKILLLFVFILLFLPLTAVDYNAGNCLEFDGVDDFVEISNAVSLLPDYTVEMWFNTSVTALTMDLLSGSVSSYHGILIELRANDDLRVLHRNPPSGIGGADIYTTGSYDDGQWHHVAVVKNGESLKLYIDGIFISETSPITDFVDPLDILIGKLKPNSSDRFYNGKIDEVRIWTTNRSEEEVQNSMNYSLGGDETGLEAYWQFNENSGSTLYDSAGTNNGTLNNMTDDDWVASDAPIITHSVTTIPTIPTMETELKIGGNATQYNNSDITAKGICWSTAPNPTISGNFTDEGSGSGEFYSTITGLTSTTQYYYRAYATNSLGTVYGEEYHIISDNIAGFCLDFDGTDDYVLIDSNTDLRPANNFTIEAWVKPANLSGNKVIIMHDDNGGGNDGYILQLVDDKTRFAAMNGGTFQYLDSDESVLLNQWNHVVGVYDNSMMKIYLNGEETALQGTGDVVYEVTDHVNIGRKGGTASPHTQMFYGEIDEIRFWNVVRSETEINENKDRYISPDETGLIGYWYFNESSGTRAYDVTNNYHGTLYNMTDNDWVISDVLFSKTPIVQTTVTSNITSSSADSGGDVSDEGFSDVTTHGVCWSTSPNPTLVDSYTTDGSGAGSFTSYLTGLNRSTEYYYRAYATNSYGTSYGEELTFYTTPIGSGTEIDPYQITNLDDLRDLSENESIWSTYFIQTADIDASDTQNWHNGAGLIPIGTDVDNGFTGRYDGQGYEIDGLYINRPNGALFGFVFHGIILNLGLTNVDLHQCTGSLVNVLECWNWNPGYTPFITNCYSTGNINSPSIDNVGGLIGSVQWLTVVTNCYSSVTVSGFNRVGGLFGQVAEEFSYIYNCYSTGDVQGNDYVGGLAGYNYSIETSGCFSTGSVQGNNYVGGLIGYEWYSEIYDCYSTGSVQGNDYVGGLNGYDNSLLISGCYSTGSVVGNSNTGGLIGHLDRSISNSYWDIESSGQTTSDGGTGYTTAQMRDLSTWVFVEWDLAEETTNGADDTWTINQNVNSGYPFLSWQNLASMDDYHPDGSGLEADPYQIGSLANLLWMNQHTSEYDKYFIQTNDIDVSHVQNWINGVGFTPIGTQTLDFTGNYDGQDFIIDNLYIHNSNFDSEGCGLFGSINEAEISNLGLTNVDFYVGGTSYIGALAGNSENYSTISNCHCSVTINGHGAGGLVGRNTNHSTIINCSSSGSILNDGNNGGLVLLNHDYSSIINCSSSVDITNSGCQHTGGLVAHNQSNSTIENSFCTGIVNGGMTIGGFVGKVSGSSIIKNCYSHSPVLATIAWANGGFIGEVISSTIQNCYSIGSVGVDLGGFAGSTYSTSFIDCFWDTETSGQQNGIIGGSHSGITGKTTAEMQNVSTYTDITTVGLGTPWDFWNNPYDDVANDDDWGINLTENNGYPFLMWQGLENQAMPYGSGTEVNPYRILTLSNLEWLSNNSSAWDKHFIQTADIDATDTQNWNNGEGFSPIGNTTTSFTGNYNGQGFDIDGIFIDRQGSSYQGFFGSIQNAEISNLDINNVSISGYHKVGCIVGGSEYSTISNSTSSGNLSGMSLGGIAGDCLLSTIDDCSSSIIIDLPDKTHIGGILGDTCSDTIIDCDFYGSITAEQNIGGIVGHAFGNSHILSCKNFGSLTGSYRVGGIVGYSSDSGLILETSYNLGDVTGESLIGGIIGSAGLEIDPYPGNIRNCYNKGFVGGNQYVGGFSGFCISLYTIKNCYSTGTVSGNIDTGGFIGSNNSPSIQGCFWDMDTSGQLNGVGAGEAGGISGNTTAEMQDTFIYLARNWDFQSETINGSNDIWGMNPSENDGYPFLSWQGYNHTAQTDFTPAGSGTETEPYQISSLKNLYWLSNPSPITRENAVWDKYFIQTADIDASYTQYWNGGEGFSPIGNTTTCFSGNYYGQNYKIDGLFINRQSSGYQGFFGRIQNADISNLSIINSEISGSSYIGCVSGESYNSLITNCSSSGNVAGSSVGGISGLCSNCAISNCSSSISVDEPMNSTVGGISGEIQFTLITDCYFDGIINSGDDIGGIVGICKEDADISNCFNTGAINGNNFIGGLVGRTTVSGTIEQSYNVGNVTGNIRVGGVLGSIDFDGYIDSGVIKSCYNHGSVSGDEYVGGFAGDNENLYSVENCYSTGIVTGNTYVGGFIGYNGYDLVQNSFWDNEISGQQNGVGDGSNDGIYGKTTPEMQDIYIYLFRDWDFQGESANGSDDIWGMNPNENGGYPFLSWQNYTHTTQTNYTPTGSGTESVPYQIGNLGNLLWLSTTSSEWDKYFIQTANIYASDTQYWNSEEGFSPIGNTTILFTGSYDGQDYSIEGLIINRSNSENQGFFGKCENASISNLDLINIEITGSSYVGGLVGHSSSSIIDLCKSNGNVTGELSVGGLIGFLEDDNQIQHCRSSCDVISDNIAGGLIGTIDRRNNLIKSFCIGDVSASSSDAGGFIGSIQSFDNDIQNCYSKSDVNGDSRVGGFTGVSHHDYSYIYHCFCEGSVSGNSYTGGFIGSNILEDAYFECFWNIETSGQQNGFGDGSSSLITGITTLEMQTQSTFTDAGWDFAYETANGTDDIWGMNGTDNEGYPFLMWQGYETGILPPQNVTISSDRTNIEITWDEVAAANSYKIFACDMPDGTFEDVTSSGIFTRSEIPVHLILSTIEERGRKTALNFKKLNVIKESNRSRSTQIWTTPIDGSKKFYYVKASTE